MAQFAKLHSKNTFCFISINHKLLQLRKRRSFSFQITDDFKLKQIKLMKIKTEQHVSELSVTKKFVEKFVCFNCNTSAHNETTCTVIKKKKEYELLLSGP